MLDRIINNIFNLKEDKKDQGIRKREEDLVLPNLFRAQRDRKPSIFFTILWLETSNYKDLFDYDNRKSIRMRDYKIDHEGNDVFVSSDNKNKVFITAQGTFNPNIFCGRIEAQSKSIFYTAGSMVENYKLISDGVPQELHLDSTIKIGRIKFLVKSIYNGKSLKETKEKGIVTNGGEQLTECEGTCKFCLCDDVENDILISPCGCKGSCAQVHVNCLKTWLNNKVTRNSTKVVDFTNYDNLKCQICKQEVTLNFSVGKKSFSILEQRQELAEPFIVLEALNKAKIKMKIKFPQDNRMISIGRSNESDVKLDDVSISRKHCFIKKTAQGFEIFDNNSRFGTLVKMEPGKKIDLSRNKVQVGKMVFEANHKEDYNQNLKP